MPDSNYLLLCNYADYLLQEVSPKEASVFVLKNQAQAFLDVMALVATNNKYMVDELRELIRAQTLEEHELRYDWMGALGRSTALLGLQKSSPQIQNDLVQVGLDILIYANNRLPKNKANLQLHKLEAELLAGEGRINEARECIISNNYLRESYYGYLLSDLSNPALCGTRVEYAQWLEGFNRPLTENGISPILASRSYIHSFDELQAQAAIPHKGGPKVSVIMTVYNPEPREFRLAVESILHQTWRNLELIIVDDGSRQELLETVRKQAQQDERIKVVAMPVNQGTYVARNEGIAVASGEFITGQDADDWSHPERIAHQVQILQENPSASGAVVQALRLDNNLVRISPGRLPERVCEISLLTRTSLAREIGGYIKSRKAADSEFRVRLEAYLDSEVIRIRNPLYFTRLGHNSLSREDFKPGWSHPARRSFWNACLHWHKTSSRQLLRLSQNHASPVPIPGRFEITPNKSLRQFEIVYVGDWRVYDKPQQEMLDEIKEQLRPDCRIGILQLDSIEYSASRDISLCTQAQTLINDRKIAEVIPDEGALIDTLIVGDLGCLPFTSSSNISLESGVTILQPRGTQDRGTGAAQSYSDEDYRKYAIDLFAGEVLWQSEPLATARR